RAHSVPAHAVSRPVCHLDLAPVVGDAVAGPVVGPAHEPFALPRGEAAGDGSGYERTTLRAGWIGTCAVERPAYVDPAHVYILPAAQLVTCARTDGIGRHLSAAVRVRGVVRRGAERGGYILRCVLGGLLVGEGEQVRRNVMRSTAAVVAAARRLRIRVDQRGNIVV